MKGGEGGDAIIADAEYVAAEAAKLTDVSVLDDCGAAELLLKYDNFLFDCDGVLWRGSELLPGVAQALNSIRERGKNVIFVTNNGTKSRAQYLRKLEAHGIRASVEEIVPSSWAAAEYLSTTHPEVKKAFVIGHDGLVEELGHVGIQVIGAQDPDLINRVFRTEAEFQQEPIDPEVGAVVCAWDLTFNFAKLALASLYLQKNQDCLFIATNKDACDRQGNLYIPGNGCAVAAVETSVSRQAVVVGKPSSWLMKHILESRGFQPRRTVVVGDRLDTDVLLGVNGGTDTVLVCTGCAGVKDIRNVRAADHGAPTYILSHVGRIAAGNKP